MWMSDAYVHVHVGIKLRESDILSSAVRDLRGMGFYLVYMCEHFVRLTPQKALQEGTF